MKAKAICANNDHKPIVVTINKLPWIVEVAERGSERLKIDGNECLAVTIYPEMKIVINDGLERNLLMQTLIHELTHAVIFSHGHNVSYDEEAVCNFIGSHFEEIGILANKIFPKLPHVVRTDPSVIETIRRCMEPEVPKDEK
ncbi:MAG: hypothetical protein Q4F78_07310 [Bacillota bacterium]|nr:hypothetical protein [Bacillota bacterium]